MEQTKEIYTVNEVAEILNIIPHSVRALIKRGRIKAETFGKSYIIRKEELDRVLKERGLA